MVYISLAECGRISVQLFLLDVSSTWVTLYRIHSAPGSILQIAFTKHIFLIKNVINYLMANNSVACPDQLLSFSAFCSLCSLQVISVIKIFVSKLKLANKLLYVVIWLGSFWYITHKITVKNGAKFSKLCFIATVYTVHVRHYQWTSTTSSLKWDKVHIHKPNWVSLFSSSKSNDWDQAFCFSPSIIIYCRFSL